MHRRTLTALAAALIAAIWLPPITIAQRSTETAAVQAREVPLYERFLGPASPLEVVAAKKVDRVFGGQTQA